jgi:flagellar M-ring protein FliF
VFAQEKRAKVLLLMEAVIAAFRSLAPVRIMALFIGLAAVIGMTYYVIERAQTPNMALLYGGLSAQEASRINEYLGAQNVAYETRGDGSIYVPNDQVGQLRLAVAGQGLVGGGTAGYELFDNQSSFGTTNFVNNLNAKRALEGELARTIGTIPAISGARVHLVLPKQNLFSREQVPPSAAIALNLGARTLLPEQVASIAQLVAAAVPNLTTANVTVIDQRGALLFSGATQTAGVGQAETLRRAVEKGYEDSLVPMLERVLGPGRVAVRVTAQLNTAKITEQSQLFDPTQQVVRSEQTVESANQTAGSGSGGLAGVQGNVPGSAGGAAGGGGSNENRTETTTNYEISKTERQVVKEGGDVERLSVAVLVAGKQPPAAAAPDDAAPEAAAEAAAPAFVALSDTERAQLTRLVQTAIGFNAERGDQVEILDMPFVPVEEAQAVDAPMMTMSKALELGQYLLLVVALALVAILVVKPALSTLNQALVAATPVIVTQNGGGPSKINLEGILGETDENGGTVDIRNVKGRVKESTVKKVTEIVDQYPEESLSVVRGWMNGGTGKENN